MQLKIQLVRLIKKLHQQLLAKDIIMVMLKQCIKQEIMMEKIIIDNMIHIKILIIHLIDNHNIVVDYLRDLIHYFKNNHYMDHNYHLNIKDEIYLIMMNHH